MRDALARGQIDGGDRHLHEGRAVPRGTDEKLLFPCESPPEAPASQQQIKRVCPQAADGVLESMAGQRPDPESPEPAAEAAPERIPLDRVVANADDHRIHASRIADTHRVLDQMLSIRVDRHRHIEPQSAGQFKPRLKRGTLPPIRGQRQEPALPALTAPLSRPLRRSVLRAIVHDDQRKPGPRQALRDRGQGLQVSIGRHDGDDAHLATVIGMTGEMTDFRRLLHEAEEGRDTNFDGHLNPALSRYLALLGHSHDFVRGEGALLWDRDGRQYLDCIAGYAVHAIGRAHPRMRAALHEALDSRRPSWVQFERSALSALLARRLSERTGGELEHAVFSNSGSEAVECALKLARRATGRDAILHCEHSFHGLTLGALAANGNPRLREPFGSLGPSLQIPFDDLPALEEALQSRRFAACIVEPVQGKTCRALSPGYLAEAARLASMHGSLLIVDEVQTGVGRTGKFFAYEHDPGARPHIVVVSKALSGGFVPIGAALVRRDIWSSTFDSISNAFLHSSTFQGGVLAMVAGLMTIEIHDSEGLSRRAAMQGERIRSGLRALASSQPCIREIRGKGLLVGVALNRPRLQRAVDSVPRLGAMLRPLLPHAFVMELLERHRVLCLATERSTDVLKFTPPLVLEDHQCDWLLRAVDASFASVSSAPSAVAVAHAIRNLGGR